MKRHIRNIVVGLTIGGIAAVVSITVFNNGTSPDEAGAPNIGIIPNTESTSTMTPTQIPVQATVSFDPAQEGTPVPVNQPESCGFSVDTDLARSVEELYDLSFVAVLARMERTLGAVVSFGGSDSTSQSIGLARVYELNVTEYLKRDGPPTIEFVQFEGSFRKQDLSAEVLNDYSLFESQTNCFSTLKSDREYVLFLRPRPGSHPNQFHPIIDPHRFALIDGKAVLDGNVRQSVRESARDFPGYSSDELLTLIRTLK